MTSDEILNMPAGLHLDALITTRIFCVDGFWHGQKPYSLDISAAWEIVEKFVSQGYKFHIYRYGNWNKKNGKRCWQAYMGDPQLNLFPYANADTAPLAICRAALLTTLEV
jgi:hypothetical protein